MRRRMHRRDNTHKAIKEGLIAAGFSVADTSQLGSSFPDLVAGKYGMDIKIECKTPRDMKTELGRRKTAQDAFSDGQASFASTWKGTPVIAAYCLEDALHGFAMLQKKNGYVR
jgi:Holliday junction resolvase